MPIQPVLLCSAQVCLWPVSRKSWPKQFVPLVEGRSLLDLTLERVRAMEPATPLICIGAEEHRFLVREAMEGTHVKGRQLLEPVHRGATASMCIAALLAEPQALLLFMPPDHHIPDAGQFSEAVGQGLEAARNGAIVAFGVTPGYPSTTHGYAGRSASANARFVDRPDAELARSLLLENTHLWSTGIFLMQAQTLIEAVRTHAPDILEACQQAVEALAVDEEFSRLPAALYERCRSERFETAILAKHDNIATVHFTGAWSDVGNWHAAAQLTPPDAEGNRLTGEASALNSRNTCVRAPLRPVVALGTDDLIIIDTPDAVLVASAQGIGQIESAVAALEAAGLPAATEHRRVARPWGAYDSMDAGPRFQVKRLTVKCGAKLSLQMHYHRAEHWVVVKGTAKVTRDNETILLR
ncbi:MAG: cpsB, partial [Variovorax sp.]|nr:cpsB [Variovorax sp.]